MDIQGNTILITGGGTGIGRGLAEALAAEGNRIIIAGRRQSVLDANPAFQSAVLDVARPDSIRDFAATVTTKFPDLNVVIHNAGIMKPENILDADTATAESIIAINLLGPIRLTAALLPHLRKQPRAAILTVSSGLAFVPLTITPTYSATKAAIHSYTQSLRHQLRATNITVHEIIPPYVQTELTGPHQATDPNAMPLADFISETISILKSSPDAPEIATERVKLLRNSESNGTFSKIFDTLNSHS